MKISNRRRALAIGLVITASVLLNIGTTVAVVDITLFNSTQYVYPGLGLINLVQLQTTGPVVFQWTSTGADVTIPLKNPSQLSVTATLTMQAENGTATPVQVGSLPFTLSGGASANETVVGKFSSATSLGLLLN